jgi:soluble lytic murein transglycosylase
MFVLPRPRMWVAGLAAALTLGAAVPAGLMLHANEPTDGVVTGSVQASLAQPGPVAVRMPAAKPDGVVPTEMVAQPVPALPQNRGSEAFRASLALLNDSDWTGAFRAGSALRDRTERHAVQWAAITRGSGAIGSADVEAFLRDAPEFAGGATLKTRLEQALLRERAPGDRLIASLGGSMPSTLDGQIALALAYAADGQKDRAARIARSVWVDNFLDAATETRVLKQLGSLIDADAHWDRAVHLMMHDRATAVERLFGRMSPAQKSLAVARNAVSRDAGNAKALLDDVDPSMQSHPVYLYSRAQRARQFELWDSAVDWLDKAKGELPDAAEFWFERRTLTRQLLALGQVKLAYRAAAGFSEGPDTQLVEAQFHAGWIAESFLKDSKSAVGHFEAMAELAGLPDTITQANFWLGRARNSLGDEDGANAAYEAAAAWPTVYYGQLAREALGQRGVRLRDMPAAEAAGPDFSGSEVLTAVRLFAANEHDELAAPLLRNFALERKDGAALLHSARLAQEMGAQHLAILIAETGEKRGIPLDLVSFPDDAVPRTKLAMADVAAVLAVARQESRFQLGAVSSAGARGLMQLMPGTAKETAGKLGLDYEPNRLVSDAEYNALLGSTYLKAQLQSFDGSLLLAAAAYNAGAGNARKWITLFGDPREARIDPVVWTELIPFQETRKYVQRVVGNYLVYRARLGQPPIAVEAVLRGAGSAAACESGALC